MQLTFSAHIIRFFFILNWGKLTAFGGSGERGSGEDNYTIFKILSHHFNSAFILNYITSLLPWRYISLDFAGAILSVLKAIKG